MKQFIVQYYNQSDGRWDFTGRVFDLTQRDQALKCLEDVRKERLHNEWRLVYVEITVL